MYGIYNQYDMYDIYNQYDKVKSGGPTIQKECCRFVFQHLLS